MSNIHLNTFNVLSELFEGIQMSNSNDIDEKVELVHYDPEWVQLYLSEAERIKNHLVLIDIQHIGSTSIPNIFAKPIIDIMIGISNWEGRELIIKKLIKLGYEYFGEANVPGRLYFRKRNKSNFNIALCRYQGEIWVNNLLFRDYLISHPEIANAYSLLKKDVINSGAHTLLMYSDRKHPFVSEVLKKAKLEKNQK